MCSLTDNGLTLSVLFDNKLGFLSIPLAYYNTNTIKKIGQ
jgi:hypothetical protein